MDFRGLNTIGEYEWIDTERHQSKIPDSISSGSS